MYVLVLHDPERRLREEVPIGTSSCSVGSSDDNTVVLKGEGVEARHFVLEPHGDSFKLVDQHTELGTIVNGGFVAQKRLEHGDRIEIGGCTLVFEQRVPVTPPPPPARPEHRPSAPVAAMPATPPISRAASSDSADAPGDTARERPRRRPERSAGAGGGLVRPLVYVGSAVILIGLFTWLVPLLTPDATADTYTPDRFALATTLTDGGKFDRARLVLRDLRDDPSVRAAAGRIERELDRIEREEAREHHARTRFAELRADTSIHVKTRIRRLDELIESYGDVAGVGHELQSERRSLEWKAEGERDRPSLDSLAEMSDSFLRAHNYSAARSVWSGLAESDLATDGELYRAATAVVDACAEVEGRKLLARVDELLGRGDLLAALIVLDESEVKSFAGASIYSLLERTASDLEARVAEKGGGGLIPGAALAEGKDDAARDAGTAAEGPDRESNPEVGNRDPATAPSLAVIEAVEQGDLLFHAGDLPGAIETYQRAVSSRNGYAEKSSLARRIERANRAQWFLRTLRNELEANLAAAKGAKMSARNGTFEGLLAGVAGDDVMVEVGGESRPVPLTAISTQTALALAKRYPLRPEDHLNRVCFMLVDVEDPRVLDDATMDAYEDPALKSSLDSVVAFMRDMPEIPDWGFFRHEGQWMTLRERNRAEMLTAVGSALAKIERGSKGDSDAYEEGLEEFTELMPVARPEILELLQKRRAGMIAQLAEQTELGAVQRLMDTRRKLEEAREHALELIFDDVKYFYPYRPPECPPDKAALYPKVQQEVDARVQKVRDIWGREDDDPQGGVPLSQKLQRLLEQLDQEQSLLVEADPAGFQTEQELDFFLLLPKHADRVTLRNIALDLEERGRLDRDDQVLMFNRSAKTSATAQELDQIRITNRYRLMMGRGALAVHDKLVRAARGHCEWMSRTGKFSHFNDEDPDLRTPGQRIAAQGYSAGGSGENIAIAGGASGAHSGWIHSSGHHRNILFPGHRELGVGGVGRYWCQNFAGGGDYSGNLQDF